MFSVNLNSSPTATLYNSQPSRLGQISRPRFLGRRQIFSPEISIHSCFSCLSNPPVMLSHLDSELLSLLAPERLCEACACGESVTKESNQKAS